MNSCYCTDQCSATDTTIAFVVLRAVRGVAVSERRDERGSRSIGGSDL